MNALGKVFSGVLDIGRVNLVGVILMLLGIALALLATKLGGDAHKNKVKVIGLIICAGAALLAILG